MLGKRGKACERSRLNDTELCCKPREGGESLLIAGDLFGDGIKSQFKRGERRKKNKAGTVNYKPEKQNTVDAGY